MSERLNHEANTEMQINQYYNTRAIQLYGYGYKMLSCTVHHVREIGLYYWYVKTLFSKEGAIYASFYLPKQYCGKGFGKDLVRIIEKELVPVITIPDYNIIKWLEDNHVPHISIATHYTTYDEYVLIDNYYGDQKARRSGLYLMNHVDEGAGIMAERKASKLAQQAFLVHPMLQDDHHFECLKNNLVMKHCSKEVIMLCMEYRKVANAYLCKPETDHWTLKDIEFACPIIMEDIKEMLIADKVQNYKDFLMYHALSHPRRNQLFTYFNNWITYLGCEEYAQKWIADSKIQIKLPRGLLWQTNV